MSNQQINEKAISRNDSSDYSGHLEKDWHEKAIKIVKRPIQVQPYLWHAVAV